MSKKHTHTQEKNTRNKTKQHNGQWMRLERGSMWPRSVTKFSGVPPRVEIKMTPFLKASSK